MSSQPDGPPTALRTTRTADRPRSHAGTSDTEKAIFDATEKLLTETPLHELSVAQIISAAGVSRATFYFYFSSKFAVVTGLLARVMEEIFTAVQPFADRDENDSDIEDALRKSLQDATKVWAEHRTALRAVMEHWNAVPELRELWLSVVQRFTNTVAEQIDRARKAGLAPAGPDSHQIAGSLIWGTERCLYVAGLGVDENIPREEDMVEPLMTLWLGGLYGVTGSGTAGRKAKPSRKSASKRT